MPLYLKEETRLEATDYRALQFTGACTGAIKFHLQAPYVVQILACEQSHLYLGFTGTCSPSPRVTQ